MNITDAKEFFEKFSLESLESLDLILPNTDPIINAAYLSVYREKFEENRDEYEGINEFDNITRTLNFEIKELDDVSRFNKKELKYLKKLLKNKANEVKDENMKNKIKRYKNNINKGE